MAVDFLATAGYGSIILYCYHLVGFHIANNAKKVGVAGYVGQILGSFSLANFHPESQGRGVVSSQVNLPKGCL